MQNFVECLVESFRRIRLQQHERIAKMRKIFREGMSGGKNDRRFDSNSSNAPVDVAAVFPSEANVEQNRIDAPLRFLKAFAIGRPASNEAALLERCGAPCSFLNRSVSSMSTRRPA